MVTAKWYMQVHVLSAMMYVHASGSVVSKAIVCKYGIMQMSKAFGCARGIPKRAIGRTNGGMISSATNLRGSDHRADSRH